MERKTLPAFMLLAFLTGLSLWLSLQPGVLHWLRLEPGVIPSGEWWRLLTGHLVQGGFSHWLFNALGFLLVLVLFRPHPGWIELAMPVTLLALAISLTLQGMHPGLEYYLGFSGILHGLFACYAMCGLLAGRRIMLLVLVLLAGKLAYEQYLGGAPGLELVLGIPVIVDAHLYGAIGGILLALLGHAVRVARRTRCWSVSHFARNAAILRGAPCTTTNKGTIHEKTHRDLCRRNLEPSRAGPE